MLTHLHLSCSLSPAIASLLCDTSVSSHCTIGAGAASEVGFRPTQSQKTKWQTYVARWESYGQPTWSCLWMLGYKSTLHGHQRQDSSIPRKGLSSFSQVTRETWIWHTVEMDKSFREWCLRWNYRQNNISWHNSSLSIKPVNHSSLTLKLDMMKILNISQNSWIVTT